MAKIIYGHCIILCFILLFCRLQGHIKAVGESFLSTVFKNDFKYKINTLLTGSRPMFKI